MKSRLFIVHGYQAQPQHHWFEWLCQQFPQLDSHIVALPHSHEPTLDAWQQALQAAIGKVDEDTYVIGHSLGCITSLHFLATQHADARLGGLLLVAGFAEKLSNLPQLDAFNQNTLPWADLQKLTAHKAVFLSEDDADVAPEASARLSAQLQAALWRLNAYGHFTQQDGCVTLPEAQQWLRKTLQENAESRHDAHGNIGYDVSEMAIKG